MARYPTSSATVMVPTFDVSPDSNAMSADDTDNEEAATVIQGVEKVIGTFPASLLAVCNVSSKAGGAPYKFQNSRLDQLVESPEALQLLDAWRATVCTRPASNLRPSGSWCTPAAAAMYATVMPE